MTCAARPAIQPLAALEVERPPAAGRPEEERQGSEAQDAGVGSGSALSPKRAHQSLLAQAVAAARERLVLAQAAAAAHPNLSTTTAVQGAQRAYHAAAWRLALTEDRLAELIAQRAQGLGDASLEDLVQFGREGLFIAAQKYDLSRGYCFATMARWWVRARIFRAAEQDQRIRPPVTLQDQGRRARKLPPGLSERESAAWLGVSLEAFRLLRLWSRDAYVYLDETPGSPNGETIGGLMVSDEADPEEVWTDALEGAARNLQVGTALLALDERRRMVVHRHLGLGDGEPVPLATLAREMGLSRERLRQIWKEAITILRAEVKAHRSAP